ncbi:hemagglutinin/amebocyte aggregation factor-like isoform X2 [Sardina pilchardus]|uniref:hemagglutinin/amebocyte aggregation factor-like isoform X2 n=1 Tax=Sardina pilchardus TaxID=27697 RepID=UPI002E1524B6
MKFSLVSSCMLLISLAATTSAAVLSSSSSTEEEMDMEKLTLIIEELASRPVYEGPYETDDLTNDTDAISDEDKRVKRWITGFDDYLFFVCPNTQSISRISSYHSNDHEDRRFSISCKATFSSNPHCIYSGWVNNFDQRFAYTCPRDYVMAGMVSYHSNDHEDRRFLFSCCRASGHHHNCCSWTPFVNYFDTYFNWNVPAHNYLTGVSSHHDNGYEDRLFLFQYCSKR